jgi:tryptophan synthase beta chain
VLENRDTIEPGSNVVVNLSGRGDKDLGIVAETFGM